MGPVRSVDGEIRVDAERSARVRRVPNTDARVQSEHASYRSRVPEASMAANQKVIAFFIVLSVIFPSTFTLVLPPSCRNRKSRV